MFAHERSMLAYNKSGREREKKDVVMFAHERSMLAYTCYYSNKITKEFVFIIVYF
jgi:hypothetical protein